MSGTQGTQTPLQTHCIHGHEFTPENTRTQVGKSGVAARSCRICRNTQDRARYWRLKGVAQ
jgi:hypothetical protein